MSTTPSPTTPSATRPISRYPVPALAELPEDVRQKILNVQEKAGFVPNVFLGLAPRPDEFRAFFSSPGPLPLRGVDPGHGPRRNIAAGLDGLRWVGIQVGSSLPRRVGALPGPNDPHSASICAFVSRSTSAYTLVVSIET